MARVHRWLGTGLAGLAAGWVGPLAAQSLWTPASDPVGIARSGTGVAFGQSLEACSLNPALLVTVRDARAGFLGLGLEMASAQTTLQSNQRSLFTGDRNRTLPSLGAAWRANDRLSFGLKLDDPFFRHAELSPESSIRFLGRSLDLKAQRLEFQAAWAWRPDLSVGAGLGLARISFGSSLNLRSQVLTNPALAAGPTNPPLALVEVGASQSGSATVPAYSAGFRWAINPRWTVAGAYEGSLRGDLSLTAQPRSDAPVFYGTDGVSGPPVSQPTDPVGQAMAATLASLQYLPGSRRIVLPARAAVGVRHRVNQFFTWELDIHHIDGASFQLPSMPTLVTPSGPVGISLPGGYRSGFGASLMGEFQISRNWVARGGARMDPALQDDATVSPLISGSRSASFSAGAGYRVWGGELSVGYMFRQNRDLDSSLMEGAWDLSGYRTVGTKTRVEGMGHLWSIGFKRSF